MNTARRMQECRAAFARWHAMSSQIMADLERMAGSYTCAFPDIERIQRAVASYYALDVSAMISPNRSERTALARMLAMKICRDKTSHTLEVLGASFGGRDHGTVRHACTRIGKLLKSEIDVALAHQDIEKILKNDNANK